MILRQMQDQFGRVGVEKVAAVGQPFDPSVHEAVTRRENSEIDAPTVDAEMQSGYLLHDRLLRPALVSVSMPTSKPVQENDGDEGAPEGSAS